MPLTNDCMMSQCSCGGEHFNWRRSIRVWCSRCFRSIDTSPIANSFAPCPYCGDVAMKLNQDPLSAAAKEKA